MNKQQLASRIWESANRMRSKIEANEYKDYILGFIFYKFLSETEVNRLKAKDFGDEDLKALREDDEEIVKFTQDECGYFIAYEDLFQSWIACGGDFEIAQVRDALSAFSRNIAPAHKKVFEGIFDTLQTGLSKLGTDSRAQTKAARDLIYLIKDIPMDARQDYDVLGFIYEYLISNFAANAGKKAGEFYTPHEVSELMSEIVAHHLQDRQQIKIYDPTSGSGSLLINIGKAVARRSGHPDSIKYFAQELKQNTYNLTRMNLVMRGILPDNIVTRNGDTLEDDWPWFDNDENKAETYEPLFVDAVVSNPPYSQRWDPEGKDIDTRFEYGLAPKSKADYAFLLHDLYHLRPDGIMTIVLPHGVLFRGGEEGAIRKNLVEHRHIQAIVGLPANIFFGTGIPTIIMVLRKARAEGDVLIVDASKHFVKEGKNNKLQASDIKRIVDAVTAGSDVPGFSRLVSVDEIRANDYNLNIPRYVDSSEVAETYDVYASMFGGVPKTEAEALNEYWNAWPNLRDALFVDDGTPYLQLVQGDLATIIEQHGDVKEWLSRFKNAISTLPKVLKDRLIENPQAVDALAEEDVIDAEIITRLKEITLLDRYAAYQELDDAWTTIAIDLEMIQTEGFGAVCAVDPNMIVKKVKGTDTEVQDGWTGRILPFGLVQHELLREDIAKIDVLDSRLSEIASELQEIIDNMSEDEKSNAAINDTCDGFVSAELKREIKGVKKSDATEFELALMQAAALLAEEKKVKSQVKNDRIALVEKTKKTIENLNDNQCRSLLSVKWIDPIQAGLSDIADDVVVSFIAKVKALCNKYSVTYADVNSKIEEAEHELISMMSDLQGNEYDMQGLAEFSKLLGGE